MGFGQWKPQQPSIQSQDFYENQDISFIYKKKLCVGKIERLLTNSAVVSLSIHSPGDLLEKTVISYKNLIIA